MLNAKNKQKKEGTVIVYHVIIIWKRLVTYNHKFNKFN